MTIEDFTIPPPETLPPVDIEEFVFQAQLAAAAYARRAPTKNPSERGFIFEGQDGTEEEFKFGDIPINRAFMAVADNMAETEVSREKSFNILVRIWAVGDMIRSDRIKEWQKECEDDPARILIHESVLTAGAVLPLNKRGSFNEEEFFQKVAELAKEYEEAEED